MTVTSPLIILAEAEAAGRMVGSSIVMIAAALGAIKCFKIMNREQTSTLGVLSLGLLLISWCISGFTQGMLRGIVPQENPAYGIVAALLGVLLVLIIVAAFVLAIIGLSVYSSKKDPPHTQGRTQAIWTLVLSAIPIIAFIVGVVSPAVAA